MYEAIFIVYHVHDFQAHSGNSSDSSAGIKSCSHSSQRLGISTSTVSLFYGRSSFEATGGRFPPQSTQQSIPCSLRLRTIMFHVLASSRNRRRSNFVHSFLLGLLLRLQGTGSFQGQYFRLKVDTACTIGASRGFLSGWDRHGKVLKPCREAPCTTREEDAVWIFYIPYLTIRAIGR
jgi:hypothetical protein